MYSLILLLTGLRWRVLQLSIWIYYCCGPGWDGGGQNWNATRRLVPRCLHSGDKHTLFLVHNWQMFANGNYHHRSGKNVWPRFSSFLGNSDTQGDPVVILRISVKFADIVLAQGQPCLQEGPHRVPWEEAGHEQGPHDQGGEESRQDREKAENSHWRLSGPGQKTIHHYIFSRRKHFIVNSLRAVPPVLSSSWRTLESSLNKPGWSWRHSTSWR